MKTEVNIEKRDSFFEDENFKKRLISFHLKQGNYGKCAFLASM